MNPCPFCLHPLRLAIITSERDPQREVCTNCQVEIARGFNSLVWRVVKPPRQKTSPDTIDELEALWVGKDAAAENPWEGID